MPQLTWITHSSTRDNNGEARKTIFASAAVAAALEADAPPRPRPISSDPTARGDSGWWRRGASGRGSGNPFSSPPSWLSSCHLRRSKCGSVWRRWHGKAKGKMRGKTKERTKWKWKLSELLIRHASFFLLFLWLEKKQGENCPSGSLLWVFSTFYSSEGENR